MVDKVSIKITGDNIDKIAVDGDGEGGPVIIRFQYLSTEQKKKNPIRQQKKCSILSQHPRIGTDGTSGSKKSKNPAGQQRLATATGTKRKSASELEKEKNRIC